MYIRLSDKTKPPSADEIREHLGVHSYHRLTAFEAYLAEHYALVRELRFPFGKTQGWGYKYSHGTTPICYVFFERGAFTVALLLGDSCYTRVESIVNELSDKTRILWDNRYPCEDKGGWLHFRVLDNRELPDLFVLIGIRNKPLGSKGR